MPKFQYTARNQAGKIESDIIEAPSVEAAVSVLQNQRLFVTDVKPIKIQIAGLDKFLKWLMAVLNRVKSEDTVIFTRQLAILIQAKVPLVQSLRVLSKQMKNPRFAEIINNAADDVDAGTVFSRALAKYPDVFSNFFIQMVRSGEISGRLEETLTYLSEYINRQYLLNSKVRGSMIYPAFIVVTFILVGAAMMIWVIPNLISVLPQGQSLPFVTQIIIWLSNFTIHWGWILLIITIVAVYFIVLAIKKSPEWRYAYDGLKLRLPIFGDLLKKIYLARFSETLSTLSSAGIAISQSLEITADVVGNSVYRKIILEADESVRKGSTISAVFGRHPEVLPMVTQMIFVGEQTGKIDTILKQVAAFFTDEVNRAFDNLVNLIEPILIVVLGIGVGILVAAILLPIYNMVNTF